MFTGYQVVKANKRSAYTAGADANSAAPSAIKALRHTYSSRDHAKRAADAKLARLQRETATVEITQAKGRPEIDTPVKLQGYPAGMDSRNWVVSKVTHPLSDAGFTTHIELEQSDVI